LCKHGAAVGLYWLNEHGAGSPVPGINQPPDDPLKTVTTYLSMQDRSALVDLMLERAREDHRFYTWLLFRSVRQRDRTVDQKRFRQYIELTLSEGVASASCSEALEAVVQALAGLLRDRYVGGALPLTEYTIEYIQGVAKPVDEDDVTVSACLDRLEDTHLRACRAVRPNPEELAAKLLEWRLNPQWEMFRDVLAVYGEVLGDEGRNVYHARAVHQWEQEPDLGPGDPAPDRYGRRFRLAYIVEAATIHNNDLEARIAVRKKDLTQPSSFLSIAELYRDAGHDEQALAWAERGAEAFSGRLDPRLRDFLIHAYQTRGRHEDAAKLLRR